VLRIFIAFKKSIASAGFEPANFRFSDKHTNHYTADYLGPCVQREIMYGGKK
jgi:hypothetical protein